MATITRVLKPASPAAARSLVDAQRVHIARELHDIVSYSLATISIQAGAAARIADHHPEQAVESLRAIQALSIEASRELRAILGDMRAIECSGSALDDLAKLDRLAATTAAAGLPTRVTVAGRARTLPPAVARAAYRIVQEALTNALRHAGAACASISVRYEPDRLVVEVLDDGHGRSCERGDPAPGHGLGITGMRERALSLGGELEVGPGRGGGCRVRATLPLGVRS
jgi:signal transduction histidine kinase